MSGTLSLTGCQWQLAPISDDRIRDVQAHTRLSPVAARCAALRLDGADPTGWLTPDRSHFHDPLAMAGMEAALERLRRALSRGERVRIITDYDVDGTTSSLILQAALRILSPDVALDFHIPDRFQEGYGFSVAAANKAADEGIDLIVTADIGVRDHAAVDAAVARGVDVLICDHHLPDGASVPERALVLCPPQAGCLYPNRSLAACGVSFKVAEGLLAGHRLRDRILASMLKLAAIGTVADMVPLTTLENRAIVAFGMQELNRGGHNAGLDALIRVAGLEVGSIKVSDLGFRIGPRINAAGRVANARLVVDLLNSRDPAVADPLAGELDHLNAQRRNIQSRLADEALAQVTGDPPAFVVVSGPEEKGWHRGVVGIVASRLKDELHRPVAVVAIDGDKAVGSVRSTPAIHAVRALESASDLLLKFGGHPAAAGFTVPTVDLPALTERLAAYAASHAPEDGFVPVRDVDAELDASDLDERLLADLDALGPFGQGNPEPRLVIRDVSPDRVEVKGQAGNLLKLRIPRRGAPPVEALWWNRADLAETLRNGRFDLLGSLERNTWRGTTTLQLRLSDARPVTD